jgi:hypothetical protein
MTQYENRPEVRVLWNASSSIVIEIMGDYSADGDSLQAPTIRLENKLSSHPNFSEPRSSR